MPVSEPDGGKPFEVHGDVPAVDPAAGLPESVDARKRAVPRTRLSVAWIGICGAALAAVALIVFMLQNTRPVEVSFLWLHGTLPLALALLVAGVGSVLVALVFGVARMTQLRRLARRRD